MGEEELIVALVSIACWLPVVVAGVLGWSIWLGRKGTQLPGVVASVTICASLSLLVAAFWKSDVANPVQAEAALDVLGGFGPSFGLGLLVDQLALMMALTVGLVATCVGVYAMGYLSEELQQSVHDHEVGDRPGRFPWFFCCLLTFVSVMLGLIFSPNLFQTFVCWELVGACSYFMIGFYRERPSAGPAATKAFVFNRVGDFGFLIGIMLFWTHTGSLAFGDLSTHVGALRVPEGEFAGSPWLIAATLGILAGCLGKSAQFPLQSWLPDAMAGPTPVSALVHSATMVAAGVYLIARIYPIIPSDVLIVIAYGGCVTMLLAALFALAAVDIKRILAWSTVSQLGYMMLAIGIGGWDAGVLHLLTHAFFKSLLFLAAGSVIHACHHQQSIGELGGLLKRMPITSALAGVGVIAICGLAFGGFHSKDAILAQSMAFARGNPAHVLLFVVPMVTACLTALYMGRFFIGTFAGTARSTAASNAHEAPATMWAPMAVLALVTVVGTLGGQASLLISNVAAAVPENLAMSAPRFAVEFPSQGDLHAVHSTAAFVAYLIAAGGLIGAWLAFSRRPPNEFGWLTWTPRFRNWLRSGGLFDEVYSAAVIEPAKRTGSFFGAFDRRFLDRFVNGCARFMVRLARFDDSFDRRFVDGLVNLIAQATDSSATFLASLQAGSLRQYVVMLSVGLLSAFALLFTFLPP